MLLYTLTSIFDKLSLNLNENVIKSIAFFGAILLIFIGCVLLFFSKYSNSAVAKKIKESTAIKMVISLIVGLAAWFFSWTPLKILFFAISIIILFSIFTARNKSRSFKAISIIILLLIVVIVGMGIPFYAFNTITNVTEIPINGIINSTLKLEELEELSIGLNDDNSRFLPDSEMSIEQIDSITLNVDGGIELEFTDDDILQYPSELIIKNDNENITISESHSHPNFTYVIKIGTGTLRKIDINCAGIEISGDGSFKDFSLNSAGTSINSQISSENNISINSTGLDINGKMEGKVLDIDSTGTNIKGELNFEDIQLDSTGVNIEINSQFNNMDINTTGINGTIEILNSETQSAKLDINGTGGALTVDSTHNAPVEIESSGFIIINRK